MALSDYNVSYNSEYDFEVGATFDSAYTDMLCYLKEGRKLPTALVVDNDLISYGVMKALQERGIRIPEDISIVGFDEMSYFGWGDPNLTTVRVYKRAMGQTAVRQLVQAIENREKEEEIYSVVVRMRTELVVKDSVKIISRT